MNQIKVILADDEEILRTNLRKKLQALWHEINILGEAGDGKTVLKLIEEHEPDIVFLDISMPGLSGMEVAKKIAGKSLVVFITAYDQYAIEAFENEAIDYILKPITDDKLKKMIKRLQNKIAASMRSSLGMIEIIEKIASKFQKPTEYLQWIKVKQGDSIRLISVNEIYFFKADNKYTLIRTKDNEFLIKKTIKELIEELNPDQFWQIHRASIVNTNFISRVSHSFTGRYEVKLKDIQETLIASRAYGNLFKQM